MGGEGTQVPAFQNPTQSGYGIQENLGDTGQGFLNDLMSRQNQGLPEKLKNLLRKGFEDTANASLVSAKRQMKESTAGKQLPTGALLNSLGDLYQQKATGQNQMNTDIAFKDYDAKSKNQMNAFQGFLGLQGAASGIAGNKNQFALGKAGMQNQYGMDKYKIDKENEFNWGKVFGDLLGAGGELGAAFASGGSSLALGASKREYKKNIKFVQTIKGVNFYNFEYKDEKHGKGLQYGVMIDEIEKILPNAVIGDKVDYNVVNSYIGV